MEEIFRENKMIKISRHLSSGSTRKGNSFKL